MGQPPEGFLIVNGFRVPRYWSPYIKGGIKGRIEVVDDRGETDDLIGGQLAERCLIYAVPPPVLWRDISTTQTTGFSPATLPPASP